MESIYTFTDSIKASLFARYYNIIQILILLPSFRGWLDLTIAVQHTQKTICSISNSQQNPRELRTVLDPFLEVLDRLYRKECRMDKYLVCLHLDLGDEPCFQFHMKQH